VAFLIEQAKKSFFLLLMVVVILQIMSRRWHYPLVSRNYSCLLHGLQTGIYLCSLHYYVQIVFTFVLLLTHYYVQIVAML